MAPFFSLISILSFPEMVPKKTFLFPLGDLARWLIIKCMYKSISGFCLGPMIFGMLVDD